MHGSRGQRRYARRRREYRPANGKNIKRGNPIGDGLTDYEEIYITGTNPLKYDTDENGVNDADDDIDGDDLSNKDEMALGTSLFSADTDEDGLSDYDEIYEYNTDPLKADSDSEGLNDSEEIAIGLDPNDPETFGVPDAEYKVEQTISADSEAMSEINTEESPYELSLEISATGNAATRLSANESTYSAVTESNARLGGTVELRYLGGDVDKVKLTYKIADEYISNENSKYAEKCLDLQGIKRYNIFRYFEEINMLLPVATEFGEESNTLYAETDELGTYCVLDMEVLMQNFGIEPEDDSLTLSTEEVENVAYSAAVYSEEDDATDTSSDEYNIIFIIDQRSTVISSEEFASIKEQILEFAKTVVSQKRDLNISIYRQTASDFGKSCCTLAGSFEPKDYDYESTGKLSNFIGGLTSSSLNNSELFGDNCVISDGLEKALANCNSNANNYIFDIYAQENSVYDSDSVQEILNSAKKNNVNISVISDSISLTGFQSELVSKTNGIVLDYSENFAGEVYEHIINGVEYVPEEIPTNKYGAEFEAILATGLKKVILNTELYANGKNPSGVNTDTDMDGLTDWDEVDFERWVKAGLIKYDDKHNVILPTIQQCKEYVNKPYVISGFDRFKTDFISNAPSGMPSSAVEANFTAKLNETRIMPISSDPTSSDGDGDGLLDSYEKKHSTSPLNADCDVDGLSDGEEYKYGTYPRYADSDYDGLDDKYEIENGLDPLNRDTDGDGFEDGEDKNPSQYDVDWEKISTEVFLAESSFYFDYLDGVIRGDFIQDPNLAQLIGVIIGSFIPLIDIRDVAANVWYGNMLMAGMSAVGLMPVIGDASKVTGKVIDFIKTGTKNVDEIKSLLKFINIVVPSLMTELKHSDEFTDAIKLLSHGELLDLFAKQPAVKKALNLAISSGDSTDEVIDIFRRFDVDDTLHFFDKFVLNTNAASIAKYAGDYSHILKRVSGHEDELISLMAKVTDAQAVRILNLTSEYGEAAVNALKTCGPENIDTIALIIHESKISGETAANFLKASANYGDALLEAVNKCGVENIDKLTNCVLGFNGENAAIILDLIRKFDSATAAKFLDATLNHGDIVIKVISKYSDPYTVAVILNLVRNYDSATAAKFLDAMLDHGDTMIKVINKYPHLPVQTMDDYLKIYSRFKGNADEIVKGCLVGKFEGLDNALNAEHSKMVCFTMQDDFCIATVSNIEFYNPTITSFDNYIDPKFIKRTDDAAKKYFRKQYDDMFTNEYVDALEKNHKFSKNDKKNELIAEEYRKL